jgi:hypothetical protein
VIRRKTNGRHMTGDHHGRTARRATLLVTATDEILGADRLILRMSLILPADSVLLIVPVA